MTTVPPLANDEDIQRQVQFERNFIGDRHATTWQSKHDRISKIV
jgi:hypothetical protein